ncbi:MAG: hypothetical protein RSE43_06835 [Oscillospiraceae bacterium]
MKKSSMRARLKYRFDNIMSKGTAPLILMLLGITTVVVVLIGVLAWLLNASVFGSLGNSIWQNLMHAIDAGALAGLPTESGAPFVALMTITTICGIFITSMLIGIINSGLESKFENLRRGNSKVIESGHTVILGFDDRIYKTISELVIANENRKKPRIVVLGDLDKQVMDEAIRHYIPDTKNTIVICRCGSTSDAVALERCSLESCRSVIVNEENDAKTIRTILAATNYLKSHPENTAHITAVVREGSNVDVAQLAGEGRAEVLYFADAMSRIVAHTCHQPGLSRVYTELFAFEGNEIYIETIPAFVGKTFGETLTLTRRSCIIGIKREGQAFVNPPMDTVIGCDDELIIIAEDDGVTAAMESSPVHPELFAPETIRLQSHSTESLLVLGHNGLLTGLLEELDCYVPEGSRVTVACESAELPAELEKLQGTLHNLRLRLCSCDLCDRSVLEGFVSEGYSNIVVLSDSESDPETADATTLMVLMYLRDIAKKSKAEFSITSEMRDIRNQELARVANVNDFVVSSDLTSLMTAQISENRLLSAIYADLLDEDGSEIYLKPASDYVITGNPVDFFTVTRAVAQKGGVFIGYKDITCTADGTQTRVVLSPDKAEMMVFDKDDYLVIISED